MKLCVIALLILITPAMMLAKNLGVYGSVYSIAEPEMLNAIHNKLIAMKKSGALEKAKKAFIARSISHILRPSPVSGVSDLGSKMPSTHLFNPAITLDRDITNSQGKVLVKAGTHINPLNIKSFDEALLFIDGDNSKQLKLTLKEIKQLSKKYHAVKVILVNGNINDTAKALKHRIYFDQAGVLCHKFGIKHTPTLLYQKIVHGVRIPRLVIQELPYA